MTNKELQQCLSQYPDDTPIRLMPRCSPSNPNLVIELTDENILHTSETAYAEDSAPEDEWDCEDGKLELGEGQQYLLFNPMIT